MMQFAARTGLSPPAEEQARYLWTDAFAVCNFLELFDRTGEQKYRHNATELIDAVHRILGRFRADDVRAGWISGLDEQSGGSHPTSGGLRIGKPHKERNPHEPLNERLEWDRDGQYFHYLTKWIHALCEAAFTTGEEVYARWAVELAEAAFKGFARRSRSGEVTGVYWKMSTDLSRSLVLATGMHDALDGFITFEEAQHAIASTSSRLTIALDPAIETLFALCQHASWTTEDPLGLGGLLFDACRLSQLSRRRGRDLRLLQEILDSCREGFSMLLASRYFNRPAAHRLAFRELGLAIGLRALPIIAELVAKDSGVLSELANSIQLLLRHKRLHGEIVTFWLTHAQHPDEQWQEHRNINEVMLATALVPGRFLSVSDGIGR
ncbi:MAG TPA: hypothetical protein VH678_14770 [Xanthobacteraceae bacterium]|jgi:hypothetical protein